MQEKFRGLGFFFWKISKMLDWVLIMLGLTILREKGFKFEKRSELDLAAPIFFVTATSYVYAVCTLEASPFFTKSDRIVKRMEQIKTDFYSAYGG